MTTPANASEEYKNEIRDIANGVKTITVGDGGNYSDIDSALDYLETVTGMTQVAGTTGTVAATADTDKVIGTGTNFRDIIKAGDMIKMSGDGISPYNFLKADNYFPIYGNITTDLKLTIATGFVGATEAGKTYEIWRSEKYTIILLDGNNAITENHALPLGIGLTIKGISKFGTVLEGATTAAEAITNSKAGYVYFQDLTLSRNISGAFPLLKYSDALDASYINFGMSNIELMDASDASGNMVETRSCNCHLNNVTGNVYAGLGNFGCDELVVNGLDFRAYDGGADICVFADNAFGIPGATFAVTKAKTINGISAYRELASTAGSGGIVEIQSLNAGRVVDATGLFLRDKDQGGSDRPHCLVFNAGGAGTLNLRNSIIQENNPAVGEGGILAVDAGDTVLMFGVYNETGGAVTTEGAATFTKIAY